MRLRQLPIPSRVSPPRKKVAPGLFEDPPKLKLLKQLISKAYLEPGKFTVGDLRTMSSLSRKMLKEGPGPTEKEKLDFHRTKLQLFYSFARLSCASRKRGVRTLAQREMQNISWEMKSSLEIVSAGQVEKV
ncbi:hypothetical protein GF415_04160 [Candidatus Micrarchaeota archaeon]|nr:hypothetical protein [Candidatus Micrarchaeota archaeon]